ncbi:MAG: type III pantothenate kinase [Planctomycetaceae bacterium]|jgi:pantothenate kinase type III|nr:type III pantothenate kinase [Planctomycetaceae bacterium]
MIAIDIGNTFAKFGYFSARSLKLDFPEPASCLKIFYDKTQAINKQNIFNAAEHKLIADWLENNCDFNDCGCDDWFIAVTAACCDVNFLVNELVSIKPDANFNILTNAGVAITANIDFPERAGIDRLLDAVAAAKFTCDKLRNTTRDTNSLNSYANSTNLNDKFDRRNIETIIVVDAGTAVTIDMVKINENPVKFEGGVILPGLSVLSEALNQAASKLPNIKVADYKLANLTYPAKNTNAAILTGILGSLVATINFFVNKIETNKNIPIFFTGGDAKIISKLYSNEFPNSFILTIPELTLTGIAITRLNPE